MQSINRRSGELALTPTQQERMLAATDNMRDYIILKATLALGCRRFDVVRLRWADFDADNRAVSYREGKKHDAIHTAFVPSDIVRDLVRYKPLVKGEYIFPGGMGTGHLSDKSAYNALQKALRTAGISRNGQNVPFHALRATCIKNCQRAGWSPEQTARHVNDTLRTIQQHYTVPSIEERKAVAEEKPII